MIENEGPIHSEEPGPLLRFLNVVLVSVAGFGSFEAAYGWAVGEWPLVVAGEMLLPFPGD